MLATFGREAARFGASLVGAVLFAAALAALASSAPYADAFAARLWGALSLDFGASTMTGVDSLAEIASTLAASATLLAPGLLLAFVLGVPLGLVLADTKTRAFAMPLMQLGRAVPVFCGALLIAVAAAALVPDAEPGRDLSLRAAMAAGDARAILAALAAMAPLVLPIGLAGAGVVAAAVSGALAEALGEPYRESLHRLGLSQREILRAYVSRRALALAMTALGDVVLAAIAATAVVERLFDWPGAGAQFIHAAALENWPVVAALIFTIAVTRIAADFMGALVATALTGTSK